MADGLQARYALTRGAYLQVDTAVSAVSASEAQAGIVQAQLDLL